MSEAAKFEYLAVKVQRLERDNCRLKFGVGAMVAVLVAAPLAGAVQRPGVIEARAFLVLDEAGEPRAALDADSLVFADEQGDPLAIMDEKSLTFYDDGPAKPRLEMGKFRNNFVIFDEQGNTRAVLDENGLSFFNEEERVLLELGHSYSGAATTYPAALVLYDEERNVIWRAPE